MKNNIVFVLIICIFLSACATRRKYENAINAWVGRDLNELILKWGPPADVFKLSNGTAMYTWRFDLGMVAVLDDDMGYVVNKYCKTTFTVGETGIIQTWRLEGNACRSR